MNTFRALLLDFERKPELGNQLREIFSGSAAPRVDLEFQPVEQPDLKTFTETLPERLSALALGLTLLVFERLPEPQEVGLLLEKLHERWHGIPSLVIAPVESSIAAMDLLRRGAADVLLAPLRPVEVLARATHWLGQSLKEDRAIRKLKAGLGLEQFIGESPALLAEIQKIPAVATCDASVLICGETGTGKEICARTVHYLSPRSDKPFVALNCGAVPENLAENELFGHEPGAFTGATISSAGLVEQANGGTLFLDEIDSLPLATQVKLLRFLQDKEYRRLGSRRPQIADVRIIAATNADLESLVRAGRFRRDFYYRLCTVELALPPLRDRGDDVLLMARHFLEKCARQLGRCASAFTAEAARKLRFYSWPGNVRELEHVVARAVLMSRQPLIRADAIALPKTERMCQAMTFKELKAQTVSEFERKYLAELVRFHHGNISKAADAAGKERRTFWQLLRKHRLTDTPSQERFF